MVTATCSLKKLSSSCRQTSQWFTAGTASDGVANCTSGSGQGKPARCATGHVLLTGPLHGPDKLAVIRHTLPWEIRVQLAPKAYFQNR